MSFIYVVASAVGAATALERECPKCHSQQVAATSAQEGPVVCTVCGALIPNPPATEPQSLLQ